MEFDHSSGYSPRACKRCKLLKRKCDKALPKCEACTKTHFKCIYQDRDGAPSKRRATSQVSLSAHASPLSVSELGSDGITSDFPPVYFLDFELFQRTFTEIPRTWSAVPDELQALTKDILEPARFYFRAIHPWLPFLSMKSFYERLLSPFLPRGADVTLLLACVKLVSSVHEGDNARTSTYVTIKTSLLRAELEGVMTLRILQAWILICVYEIGHAIYPSASISINICAKYVSTLGINETGIDTHGRVFDWVESEERTRAWWAVVILDRFLNLGSSSPSLSMQDPSNNARLPIDDISWDKGVRINDHPVTLSCPATASMGRYGLMAHASSLLGKALQHGHSSVNDANLSGEEAAILDRALAALTTVTHEEGAVRGIGVCTPTVLCFSARITLALHKQNKEAIKHNIGDQESNSIRIEIAKYMVKLAQWSTSGLKRDDEISPIPLHAAYYSVVALLEMHRKHHNEEYLSGIEDIKGFLRMYNQRWRVGGVYLKMLDARETMYLDILS